MGAKPDAILVVIPKKQRVGATLFQRVDRVCTWAESILGLDRRAGRTAQIHMLHQAAGKGDGALFITGDPEDLLYFPRGHPFQMRERYRWVAQLDGSLWGYLVDEARSGSTSLTIGSI